MQLSVFDLFKIGIGPSSSHTVGPMWAALRFAQAADARAVPARVRVDLYGSLALTGRGHATDVAVLLGLSGERPDTVDPDAVAALVDAIRTKHVLRLAGHHAVAFDPDRDLLFHDDEQLPRHPNGMRLTALDDGGAPILSETFYSTGGGFVVTDAE